MKKAVKQIKKELKDLKRKHESLEQWHSESNTWFDKRITKQKWWLIILFTLSIVINILIQRAI